MVVRILNFQNYKRQMPIVFAFGERHPAKFHFDRFTHCTETSILPRDVMLVRYTPNVCVSQVDVLLKQIAYDHANRATR